jgi:predicted O-methyltransferase YrrM
MDGALQNILLAVGGLLIGLSAGFFAARQRAAARSVAKETASETKQLPVVADNQRFFDEVLAEGTIRPIQLAQLFPGVERVAVEIGAIDPDTEHANHTDMLYVCAIARHVKARRIFEFGTYLGRTTYHLARGEAVERVYTLDLDPKGEHVAQLKLGQAVRAVLDRDLQGHFYRGTPYAERVMQLHEDSRKFDVGPYRQGIDFLFIDAGHSYEMIANDTKLAMQMLKPGGVIVWHDFAPKGQEVVSFGRDLARDKPLFWIEDTSLLVYVDGVDSRMFAAKLPPYARSVLKPGVP